MKNRRDKILSCIDPSTQKGLEIGALDRPLVTKQMGPIRYVDYTTTEELRKTYTRRNPKLMVEVDYVWGSTRLDDLVADEFPFDYVIASHVLEHVPNLIGWLNEVGGTLRPGGYLSLALPDKTRCFDYFRRETVISDVVDAYIRDEVKPSPKAIFESKLHAVSLDRRISWSEEVKDESKLKHIFNLTHALKVTREAYDNNAYYDSHCWVFTPQSIVQLFRDLIELDLLDFSVQAFSLTSGCEFFVTLQKIDTENRSAASKQAQFNSLPTIDAPAADSIELQLQKTQQELAEAKAEVEALKRSVKEAVNA